MQPFDKMIQYIVWCCRVDVVIPILFIKQKRYDPGVNTVLKNGLSVLITKYKLKNYEIKVIFGIFAFML